MYDTSNLKQALRTLLSLFGFPIIFNINSKRLKHINPIKPDTQIWPLNDQNFADKPVVHNLIHAFCRLS